MCEKKWMKGCIAQRRSANKNYRCMRKVYGVDDERTKREKEVYWRKKEEASQEVGRALHVHNEMVMKEICTQNVIAKTCETAIKSALHLRSAILVIIQVLHGTNSTSLLACCINAAFLSLLDTGISLDFLVGAVSRQIEHDGKIVLDCCGQDIDSDNVPIANVTVAFENQHNQVISCVANDKYTREQIKICMTKCQAVCRNVFAFYRTALIRKVSKVA